MQKRIWITWETQRRSVELSRIFNCKLYIIEYKGVKRYPISILKTLFVVFRNQPDVLFVQNPSMILATIACMIKSIFHLTIIVDRHTTFRLDKPKLNTLRNRIFMKLHYFTIKHSDLTIVTNEYLASLVNEAGGKSFVLPDKLPFLNQNRKIELMGQANIILISSFSEDEPVSEVIEAMKEFGDKSIFLYITGNYHKLNPELPNISPPNVIFTGFMPEQDYVNLLCSVDIAMAFTFADFCMLCGCYEAISAQKPLITTNKQALMSYFNKAVFVDNSASSIALGIKKVLRDYDNYRNMCIKMKEEISISWNKHYMHLETYLNQVET